MRQSVCFKVVALVAVGAALGGCGTTHRWISPSARVVSISVVSRSGPAYPILTVTSPARVQAVIAMINSLAPVPTGVGFSCPAETATQPLLRFAFRRSAASPVRVSATQDGCVSLNVSAAHTPTRHLWVKFDLVDWLSQHGMLPACSDLAASASYTTEMPGRRHSARILTIVDRSRHACGIIGWPEVQLLTANAKTITTHDIRQPPGRSPVTPILMDRALTVTSVVSWRQNPGCHGAQATQLRVQPPGSTVVQTIPISSATQHPAVPCNRQVSVTGINY